VKTVAVDGPSASGKSTVSRRVAEELGFAYVDSGALYRGVTWKAVREAVDVKDAAAVIDLVERMDMDFYISDRVVGFTIDGDDPGQQIRSEPVRERVSDVAVIPEVRAFIVARLREMVRFGDLVMEGRDIGSVVFPDSRFKFYLDADPEERARRRHEELVAMEGKSNVDEVLHSLARRDQIDSTRKTAPLQIALGAHVVNTTAMAIDEVVAHIVGMVREAGDGS
jgi:cytidylate kinase